jgi:hypothetical protein
MLGTAAMRCGSMVETMVMIWINGGNNHIWWCESMVGTTIYNDVDHIHGERWLSSRTRACRTWFPPDGWMDEIVWAKKICCFSCAKFLCEIWYQIAPNSHKCTLWMGSIPSSLFFWYSDPWIRRRERAWLGSDDEIWELGSKLQSALDPFSSLHLISSDLIQASLLITKLWIHESEEERELGWGSRWWDLRAWIHTSVCFGSN